MALDIMRITAALNAYPWIPGTLTAGPQSAANYCALGMLLRYAGVAQSEIASTRGADAVWARYRELLESEYGITEFATIGNIITANDFAPTHEEAIKNVQIVLEGGDVGEVIRARQAAAIEAHAAAARKGLEDDAGGCAAILV
jgi:hypothetical protein